MSVHPLRGPANLYIYFKICIEYNHLLTIFKDWRVKSTETCKRKCFSLPKSIHFTTKNYSFFTFLPTLKPISIRKPQSISMPFMDFEWYGFSYAFRTLKKGHTEKWRTQRQHWCVKHQRIFASFINALVYCIP